MTFPKFLAKHSQVLFTVLFLIIFLVPINTLLSVYTQTQKQQQQTEEQANSAVMEMLRIEEQNRQNRNQLVENRPQTPAKILDEPKKIIPLTEFDSIGKAKEVFGPKLDTSEQTKNSAPDPNQILNEAKNSNKVSVLNSILGNKVQAASSTPFLSAFGQGQIELPWTAGEEWILTSGYNSAVHSGKTAFLLNFARPGGTFNFPVKAMSNGVVVDYATTCRTSHPIYGCNDGWGFYVILKVSDGQDGVKYIQYDHMASVAVSSIGQEIPIGQEIGRTGDTGYTDGTHLEAGLTNEPSSGNWNIYKTIAFPTVRGVNVSRNENPIATFAGRDFNKFRSTNVGGNSDLDNDGISNLEDNCPETPNPDQKDSNGDGVGDACDRDGDGVEDYQDNCVPPNPWNGSGSQYFYNPDQKDSDGNGVGDTCDAVDCAQPSAADPADALFYLCDPDWDKDGVVNVSDNCPFVVNADQLDANQNGKGDACDPEMKVARKYFNPKPAYYRNMGYNIPSGVIGDPINPSNGNFYQQENDFNLPGPTKGVQEGITPELNIPINGLNLERVYNSVDNRKGVFGKGWNSNLLTFVDFYDQNQYGVSQTGGNVDVFEKSKTCDQIDNSKPNCYAFKAVKDSTDTTAKLNFSPATTFKATELGWTESCPLPKVVGNQEKGYQNFLKNLPLYKNTPNIINGELIKAPELQVVYPDCFNFNFTDKFGNTTIYHWDTTTDSDPNNDWKAGLPIFTKQTDGEIIMYEFAKSDQIQSKNSIQNFKYLKSISNNFGQKISFEFNTSGFITKAQDNLGRTYKYNYDLDGNLIQVDKPSPNLSPALDSQNKFVSTKYSYNIAGYLTTVTDPTGRKIVDNTYNDQGKVVSQKDASGKATTLEYNFNTSTGISSKTVSTLRNGAKIEQNYDLLGRLTKQVDELGAAQTTEYKDGSYAKTKETDALGRVTVYEYDERNNPVKITLPDGTVSQNQFDQNSKIISKTQGDRTWKFEYNGDKLISKTDPGESKTTFGYDQKSFDGILPILEVEKQAKLPDGLKNTDSLKDINKFTVLSYVSDPKQNQTKFSYSAQNQIESIQNPDGGLTKLGRDVAGRLIQRTSPEGGIVKMTLDGQNNVAQTENSLGGKTIYAYFENGLLRAKIDPSGLISTYNYNSNKKLTLARQCLSVGTIENCEQKPSNQAFYDQNNPNGIGFEVASTLSFADKYKTLDHYDTLFEYDAEDFLTKTIDPEGKITSYKVDLKGQRLETLLPDGNKLKNEFDQVGNTIKYTDELNRETKYAFDSLNRLVSSIRPDGAVKSIKYNGFGNIVEVKDFDQQSTFYSYDQRDNMLEAKDKLGRVSHFEYDLSNNQTKTIDALNNVSAQEYDSKNQPVKLIKPNGLTVKLAYNLAGQVISKQYLSKNSDLLNNEKYAYDKSGNIIQQINALGGSEVLVYDQSFRVTQRQIYQGDPASSPVYATNKFEYDTLGRQISQTDPQGFKTTSIYSPSNKLVKYTDRRGNSNEYHFDIRSNPIKQTNENGDSRYLSYNADKTLNCQTTFKTLDLNQSIASQNGLVNPDYSFEKAKVADGYNSYQGKETTCYKYDNLQRIVESSDPLGQVTKYSYDLNNNAVSTTNSKGQTTSYKYDALNNLLETTDTGGFKTSFVYDALNRVIAQTNAKNQTTQLFYDTVGNQTAIIYPNTASGQSSNTTGILDEAKISVLQAQGYAIDRFEYNELSSKISFTDPNNQVIKYSYNAANLISKIQDASNNITNYGYDNLLRQNKITYPTGGFDALEYDNRGNLSTKTDRYKAVTKYSYDPNQNLIKEISPLNNEIGYSYDSKNRLSAVSDSISRLNQLNSSLSSGLILSQSNGQGLVQSFKYDQNDKVISKIDALGNEESQVFDPLGRLVQMVTDDLNEDKLGGDYKFGNSQNAKPNQRVSKSYKYDQIGLLTQSSNELGDKTSFAYNSQNNLIETSAPNGAKTKVELDPMGNTLSTTDALNRATKYTLDGLNRNIEILDANGGVTKFAYDLASNQVSGTNPNGNTTTSKYVKLQDYKLAQSTDPLGFNQIFSYDGLGRVIQKQDKNGNKYSYIFDDGNRFYQENQPENVALKYNLNAIGKTEKYTDGKNVVYSYQYDQRGRQTDILNPDGGKISNVFDPLNRITQETSATGGVTQSAFGPRGELLAQKQPDGEFKYYQYDAKVRLSSEILPTTVKNTSLVNAAKSSEKGGKLASNSFEYDSVDNLTASQDVFKSQTKYSYDLVKNQLSSTDPKGGVYNYTFDNLNNLLSTQDPLGNQTSYKYDPNSNLTLSTDPKGGNIKFEYSKRDELKLKTDQLNRTNQYFYDGNGNEINLIKADGLARVQDFDGLNRLSKRQYQTQNSTITEPGSFAFKYDQNSNLNQANQVLANNAGQAKISFNYDDLNRIKTQQTENQGIFKSANQVDYSYDKNSNLTSELIARLDPSSQTTQKIQKQTFSYSAGDKLQNLQSFALNGDKSNLVNQLKLSYDPAGQLISRTNQEGKITDTYSYDLKGRILSSVAPGREVKAGDKEDNESDSSKKPDQTYANTGFKDRQYDTLDRVISQYNFSNGLERLDYDPVSRLTSYKNNQNQQKYEYDALGNRTKVVSQSLENRSEQRDLQISNKYDAANQLMESYTPYGNINYRYDLNGNQIQSYNNGFLTAQSYFDGENKPVYEFNYSYDPKKENSADTEQKDKKQDTQISVKYQQNDYLFRQVGRLTLVSDQSLKVDQAKTKITDLNKILLSGDLSGAYKDQAKTNLLQRYAQILGEGVTKDKEDPKDKGDTSNEKSQTTTETPVTSPAPTNEILKQVQDDKGGVKDGQSSDQSDKGGVQGDRSGVKDDGKVKADTVSQRVDTLNKLAFIDLGVKVASNSDNGKGGNSNGDSKTNSNSKSIDEPVQDAVNKGGNGNSGGCNNTGSSNNGGGNNSCNPTLPTAPTEGNSTPDKKTTPAKPEDTTKGGDTKTETGKEGDKSDGKETSKDPKNDEKTVEKPKDGEDEPKDGENKGKEDGKSKDNSKCKEKNESKESADKNDKKECEDDKKPEPENVLIYSNPSKLEVLVGDHTVRSKDQVESNSLNQSVLLTEALDAVGFSQVQIDNQNYRQFSYDPVVQDFGKYTQTPLLGTSFKNKTKVNSEQNKNTESGYTSEIELSNQKTLPVSISYNSDSTQINLFTPSQNSARSSSSDPMAMNFGSPARRLLGSTQYTQRNDYILAPSFDLGLDESFIPAQYKKAKSKEESPKSKEQNAKIGDSAVVKSNEDGKSKGDSPLEGWQPQADGVVSSESNKTPNPSKPVKPTNPKDLIDSLKNSDLSYIYVPNTLSDLAPNSFNSATKLAPGLDLAKSTQTQLSFQNTYNYHTDYLNTLHSVTQTKDTLTFTDIYGPHNTVRSQSQNSVQKITQDNPNARTVLTQSFDPFGQTLSQNEYPYSLVSGLFTNKGKGDSGDKGNKQESDKEKDCKSQSVNSQNCNQISNFNYQKPIFSFSGAQNESYSSSIPEYQGDSGLIKAKGNDDKIDNLAQTNKKKNDDKKSAGGLFNPNTPELNFGRRNYAPDTGTFTAQDPVVNGYNYNSNATNNQIGLNHGNILGGFLKQAQNPYLLLTNNPLAGKDVDGYCFLGIGCENENRARDEANQAQQKNQEIQRRNDEIQRKNQELNQLKADATSKINGDVGNLKNNISSFNDKSANLNKAIESGDYLIRNVYVPNWKDYAGSSEKLYNDILSSHIAFASICSTDTKPPYGCNSYDSQIAKNYDLSVSPNVKGFAKYQAENTRVWYTVDEARLNADVSALKSEADKLAADKKNIEDYAASISKDLTEGSDSLQKDITNLKQEAEQNQKKLEGANKVLSDSQMFNSIATIVVGVGAGLACTALTAGVGALACAGITGAIISGVGNANSQYIAKGSLSEINLGEVGINAAIGGISNLVAPGLANGLSSVGVKGLANAVVSGALMGAGSGGLLDFGTQLANNGYNLGAVNYNQTLGAMGNGLLAGAAGGAIGYGVGQIGSKIKGALGGAVDNITEPSTSPGCSIAKADSEDDISKVAALIGGVEVSACPGGDGNTTDTTTVNGNSKASTKPQHGYQITDKTTGNVLEYGISGQPLNKNGTSPRVAQKINVKYNGSKNVTGQVLETNMVNRQAALDWEIDQVLQYKADNGGVKPINQIRPNP